MDFGEAVVGDDGDGGQGKVLLLLGDEAGEHGVDGFEVGVGLGGKRAVEVLFFVERRKVDGHEVGAVLGEDVEE